MTRYDEIQQLKERLFQKDQLLLSARAELAIAMINHFGKEAEMVIKKVVNASTRTWAASVAESDKQAHKKNDIQGLINFLWKPLVQEGFEFTYENHDQCYQLHVTKCPIADAAKAMNLEKWGFIFYCMGDEAICEGYNPDIRFTRTKTLMEGDAYCNHCYSYHTRKKR
ncbi:MAG: L-2-amino-thiazoline-4-carboxylic acid hydrolase [Desulfobacteraceae bacterium]|jgi:predicted ArsR family transcriptional regulator